MPKDIYYFNILPLFFYSFYLFILKDGKWQYSHGGTTWKTYFDWTFVFGWQTMAESEIKARKSLIEPIRCVSIN